MNLTSLNNIIITLLEAKSISEELLSKAMKEGYVECKSAILLLVGVAGAGKSSFKRMLFKDKEGSIQVERNSTPLAEAAIRAVSTSVAAVNTEADDVIWKEVTSESLRELLAEYALAKSEKDPGTPNPNMSPPTTEPKSSADRNHDCSQNVNNTSSRSNDVKTKVKLPPPFDQQSDETETSKGLHGNLNTMQAVTKLCERIRHISVRYLKDTRGQTWIYIIDSGGQPQFQELLPLFIKSASAVAFFVKLNETLDHPPLVEYFLKGNPQGKPYQYSLTHWEVLQNSLHTVQSRKGASGESGCPSLLYVGTFRDMVSDCSESIKSKNESIRKMMTRTNWSRDNLISYFGQDPLFCVNAQHPDEKDFEVVKLFRHSVTKRVNSSLPFKVPIKWFLFEQILQEMSHVKRSNVFSMEECNEIASWLDIDNENLCVALDYLTRHNVVSWFKNILPDVIFTSAQVILDKLSELVHRSYILSNNCPTSSDPDLYGMEGIWYNFQHYGYITVKILEHFGDHYNETFTPSKFLALLIELLIVAKDSEDRYFMPCILRDLSKEEVQNYRIMSTKVSPLLLYYEKQFFPTGVFSCLISYLRNKSEWNILKENDMPKCFYKNCVKFIHKTITITLIYTTNFIEVYPMWGVHRSYADCQKDCHLICTTIQEGLCEAAKVQNYDHLSPKVGIQCPHTQKDSVHPHIAVKCVHEENCWQCTLVEDKFGYLTSQHQLWFLSKLTSTVYVFD